MHIRLLYLKIEPIMVDWSPNFMILGLTMISVSSKHCQLHIKY